MTTATCFQIHADDNVATMLDEDTGTARVFGVTAAEISLGEKIPAGHKVAIREIAAGAPVIKYGTPIGHALRPIVPGSWVHLHNLASDLDQRSGSLDLQTGAPTDTSSAYA